MPLHDHCLICSAVELENLPGYEKDYLCQCKACNFVFSRRIPTSEELNAHYEGYGRADYLSPITIKRYHELLDKMEKYRKTNRLLDVGCGIGYFLEVAKERGWEVYGTEFTDKAVEICEAKGINMQQGVLDPKHYDAESFDVITSFEVIEHINNPQPELANFHSLLRKGGLVYATTPNFNSLLRYRLKGAYNNICYPEHLSYYTPATLKKVFNSAGFKALSIEATGISITRLRQGTGKTEVTNAISQQSEDEQLRVAMEEKTYLQIAKKLANGILTMLGVGDSLKGWFTKW